MGRVRIFDVATLIEILSEVTTLEPGDVCAVTVESIGTLSNPIRDTIGQA